ncbi:MAG TPA: glycoside hydrolase family 76 protein [Pseudonocardiaceae bacterium]|nr:glycoside hydrolase family 76 protein [Pseudonocardiaceae bacterium]
MRAHRRSVLLSLAVVAAIAATLIGGVPGADGGADAHADSTSVCSVYCDTRDPSLARQETFPVPNVDDNGRLLELHVDDADGMAWASVDNGVVGDSVWLDRSWDGGATWDGLLGEASIPQTWTGTRTLMYNLYDPLNHRRGLLRACADAAGVACTSWAHLLVCNQFCDQRPSSDATGDSQPVAATTLSGRQISLHMDPATGIAWGVIADGEPGDEVWLDRSWNEGQSWPDGSSLGRLSVPAGATGTQTAMFNTSDQLGLLYGGAVRACGRAVEGENGSCTAWARPSDVRASAAADALMYSYDPNNAWWPSSWWNSASALTSLIDYLRASGSTEYDWVIAQTFTVNRVAFPAGARGTDPIQGDFISDAIDDSQWWALAWIDAYDLTGDSTYLNEAVTIADYVSQYWDPSTCGGGVWWSSAKTYKNAITNALYIRLTAALHNRTPGDTLWLGRAQIAWNWFMGSGMVDSAGLVNDGLTSSCANNGQTVWTYNQGMLIGAAVELWRATGDSTVLATARRLADAAIASPLVVSGVLTESCDAANATCDDDQKQFKGIFTRYLGELATVTGDAGYQSFLTTQANTMWAQDRDSLNQIGERWSGLNPPADPNISDWRTEASALDALDAVDQLGQHQPQGE